MLFLPFMGLSEWYWLNTYIYYDKQQIDDGSVIFSCWYIKASEKNYSFFSDTLIIIETYQLHGGC